MEMTLGNETLFLSWTMIVRGKLKKWMIFETSKQEKKHNYFAFWNIFL